MPDRQISADAANEIGMLLDSVEHILAHEQETQHSDRVDLPPELRWRVMVLGCSVDDMNVWIRRDPGLTGIEWFIATEIRTGCDANGATAREAMNNHFTAHPQTL